MPRSARFLFPSPGAVCFLLLAGLWLLTVDGPWAAEGPAAAETARLEEVFNGFYRVGLDLDHPLHVENLAFQKDAMDLTLKSGTLYFAQPFEGVITGAYFSGQGTVKVTLPNATEKKSLKRWTGKDTFDEPITEAVLRFDDGSEKVLSDAKAGGTPVKDAQGSWEAHSKVDYNSGDFQLDFMESRLGNVKNHDFLYLEARTADNRKIYFGHMPGNRVENALLGEKSGGAAGKRLYEPWSSFHKRSDYDGKGNYNLMPEADDKHAAALRNVDMTVEIPNTKSVLIDALVTVESLTEGLKLLRFDLVNNLDASSWDEKGRPVTVTRVADASGADLPYVHKWHQLLVLLPKPLSRGEKTQIRVGITEDTIIQLTLRSYWIYTTYSWFPQMGDHGGRYTFDWKVKIAKPLKAAGSGELVREWEEGKMNCGEWRSTVPVMFPSFIFGEFVTTDGVYQREAPGSGEVALRLYAVRGGSGGPALKPENILYNVQQGIKAYESLFGPFPSPDLDITEMAQGLGFSQSPPGVLFLSGVMSGTGGGGRADQVLFHELAHQYWGTQVGWVASEDDWISESWAEYSAGLITEGIDPKKFAAMRKDWKKFAAESEHEATIATAYRSEWRLGLLYSKGPYVVHMLRSWMGWEKFAKLVGNIQSKYKGRNINTDTLAREASSLMGYDMFPFFDQWIRGTGIPKVHYSWTAAPDADGKVLVTIKTRQEDKENFKVLLVPIAFDFGKEKPVVVSKPIVSAESEIKIKVPMTPKDVRLDEEASQLADFIHDK
ncbi:MAG TPA: M1 family aminopeptidase [Candidatus Polarisedimenticolia bacterium]|nr:M1 family aminopeptidase [Candidatus Polarisedimenticolia bacterium]